MIPHMHVCLFFFVFFFRVLHFVVVGFEKSKVFLSEWISLLFRGSDICQY